jgi:hypothetical protein
VVCPTASEWRTESKSVGLICEAMDSGYYGICSGALINKEKGYLKSESPYFLSANHCYENSDESVSNLNNWVFIFKHESSLCGSDGSEISITSSLTKSVVGAKLAARDNKSDTSDFLLLKLNCTVSQILDYDITFAGWNNLDAGGNSSTNVGIHHPNGDIKKFSISHSMPVSSGFNPDGSCPNTFVNNNTHWKVVWSEGITAPGSSGSPLFNENHQIIGALHGGFSYCKPLANSSCSSYTGPQGPDYYGKFSKSWLNKSLSKILSPSGYTSMETYNPPIQNELAVTIETSPKNVFVGDNTFLIKATSANGLGRIYWNWWVNKIPDDFREYDGSNSSLCAYYYKTTDDRVSSIGPFNWSFGIGNYRVRLNAYDSQGKQTNIEYTLVVTDRTDDCISAHIFQTECAKKYEFPKNSTIQLQDYASVISTRTYSLDDCHTRHYESSEYYFPKFDGISKLKWFYDDVLVKEYNFNTTWEYYDPYSQYTAYYFQTYRPACFTLSSSSGIHAIRMEAYGGALGWDGYQFINPLLAYTNYSSITKKIKIVDCYETKLIDASSDLINDTAGYINIIPASGSIIINSGANKSIKAYQSIAIKPGVNIKSGANLSIKKINCPDISECSCNSLKSTDEYQFENSIIKQRLINELEIFPNPTLGIVNINIPDDCLGGKLILTNINGQFLSQYNIENNFFELDLSFEPNGIYFIKILSEDKVYIQKIVLSK